MDLGLLWRVLRVFHVALVNVVLGSTIIPWAAVFAPLSLFASAGMCEDLHSTGTGDWSNSLRSRLQLKNGPNAWSRARLSKDEKDVVGMLRSSLRVLPLLIFVILIKELSAQPEVAWKKLSAEERAGFARTQDNAPHDPL